MRSVLLGADFAYNFEGKLVPIEINTNVGIETFIPEGKENIFDLTALTEFIVSKNFKKVTYIGCLWEFGEKLSELCKSLNITYELFTTCGGRTVPFVEDAPDVFIIRSAYDSSAVVDEDYCKNKINFLNLIKSASFGAQYAYFNDEGILINNITTIRDNGAHPNFILKAIYPSYQKKDYPKFFRVTNQDELNTILLNIAPDTHLMEFYFNPNAIWENHLKIKRSLNILFPPNLESIPIAFYTKITRRNLDELSTYDPNTFELASDDRSKYITSDGGVVKPKLVDTDLVEMADGSFKTALELQIGDMVKTIDIPNPNNVDLTDPVVNFHIDLETFTGGTTFRTNKVTAKARVDAPVHYVKIYFTDGTTWEDTQNSTYLILRDNPSCHNFSEVRFVSLFDDNEQEDENCLRPGDHFILVGSLNGNLVTILKDVQSTEITQIIFGGWEITVEQKHMFLTKAEDSDTSFVAIEHNAGCSNPCSFTDPLCAKGEQCCGKTGKEVCNTVAACAFYCGLT